MEVVGLSVRLCGIMGEWWVREGIALESRA